MSYGEVFQIQQIIRTVATSGGGSRLTHVRNVCVGLLVATLPEFQQALHRRPKASHLRVCF